MLQQHPEDRKIKLRDTAISILTANGYRAVTHNKELFPSLEPDLAMQKDSQLLVFAIRAYPSINIFLSPAKLNEIRVQLEAIVSQNKLAQNQQAGQVRRVALVMTPEEVKTASEDADIQWLVVSDYDELPEQIDKVIS